MNSITVAIADIDCERRAGYERLLQGKHGIKLLTNLEANIEHCDPHASGNLRFRPRKNASVFENEVARIKRLKPHVMLVNLDMGTDMDQALLLSLRCVCPDAQIVLLADDSVDDDDILQALKMGVRGYLKKESAQRHLSRAVKMVGYGETWVPRKMLGDISNHISKFKVGILAGESGCSKVFH